MRIPKISNGLKGFLFWLAVLGLIVVAKIVFT